MAEFPNEEVVETVESKRRAFTKRSDEKVKNFTNLNQKHQEN